MKNLYLCAFLTAFITLTVSPPKALAQDLKLACSHNELCLMAKTVALEFNEKISTETLVTMSGDPHEFEPTINELKALISAPVLLIGPHELNPWIKKVQFQRAKNKNLVTIALSLTPDRKALYAHGSSEAFAHFWLYPKIYCEMKSELAQILFKKPLKDNSCDQKAKALEEKLKTTLSKVTSPIVLTHDALWPLLQTYKTKELTIVAIKGSGHHEEATAGSVKKLYAVLKSPRVIWLEETGIHVPGNVTALKRKTDSTLTLDTAKSFAGNLFGTVEKLNDELIRLGTLK